MFVYSLEHGRILLPGPSEETKSGLSYFAATLAHLVSDFND
jgi:hypothetical protein